MSEGRATDLGHWSPLSPREAAEILASFRRPWWIAGGWAIDLFVGRAVREHGDLDVEILRRDQLELREALPSGLEGWVARKRRLSRWEEGAPVPVDANGLWLREEADGPWRFEVMLAASEGDRWLYRRDPSVSLPLAGVGGVTVDGIPYLRPEVVLLFKARTTRPRDEQDFAAALPLMDGISREWLRRALETAHPGHPWAGRL